MWYIATIVAVIGALKADTLDIRVTYLIASGLFAIAGEIGLLSTRLKKFFENGMRIKFTNKEDSTNDGKVQ